MRNYAGVAARALTAARAQSVTLPDQDIATAIIVELATNTLALDRRLADLDAEPRTDPHPGRHRPSPRRIDVLWALLRDERISTAVPPTLAQAA